jgi:hypothetical protein
MSGHPVTRFTAFGLAGAIAIETVAFTLPCGAERVGANGARGTGDPLMCAPKPSHAIASHIELNAPTSNSSTAMLAPIVQLGTGAAVTDSTGFPASFPVVF